MMVTELHKRNSLNHCMSLLDFNSHSCDDSLQLCPNCQYYLHKKSNDKKTEPMENGGNQFYSQMFLTIRGITEMMNIVCHPVSK